MVSHSTPTRPIPAELLDRIALLRTDADLMDDYARRLFATAASLNGRVAAPEWSRPTLARQAAACRTTARQLRAAAEALLSQTGTGPRRSRRRPAKSAVLPATDRR
ncbi:hypothetical protein ACGFYO_26455 [Streptomyces sp. NPDC048201]|uniref:hypothetical protein n=1 Tax=Streptomyces sp. NPDC048201 TaxID=3365513 RepID=UPI00371C3923